MGRADLIRLRRDTAANWASVDPVLDLGEPGFDTTNGTLKIGDGSSTWSELDGISGGEGGGAVDSVNGDTGTVVLDADDIDDTSTDHKFASAAQLSAADSAIQSDDLNTALAATPIIVDYGSTAGTARPSTSRPVIWTGDAEVEPTNAEEGDLVLGATSGGGDPDPTPWTHEDTIAFFEVSEANFTPDSGAGATLTDLSGNGNHATRTTGNAHPSLVLAASSPMGIDSLLKDSDNEFFDPISGAGPNGTDYIVAWLARDDAGTRTGHIAGSTTADDGNNLWQYNRDNSEPGSAYHDNTVYELGTGTGVTGTNQVVVMRYDKTAGQLYLRVDGVAVDDTAVAADYLGTDLQLFTFNDLASNAFYGHMANFGLWASADTDLVDEIESYLLGRLS